MGKQAHVDHHQPGDETKPDPFANEFVETAYTLEQVLAAIEAEKRLGIIDGKCAFLGI